ncbi:MAG: hypothetical protein IJ262_01570 [Clostridia bacterium]|nr:hypothetical protein [Clostridia bacterium]
MRDYFKKIEKETLFAGVFGLVALVAIAFEMFFAGFDSSSVAGAIKDIAGTVLDVVMLVIALNVFRPKKKAIGGFEERFNEEMEKIISKYNPLIQKDISVKGRYNIADDMAILYQNIDCKYHRLFDFDGKREISFVVSKTLFMGKSKDDFSQQQKIIIDSVAAKVINEYSVLNDRYKVTQDGFKLTFNQELTTPEDAVKVAEVIDKIILLYIVEYKK